MRPCFHAIAGGVLAAMAVSAGAQPVTPFEINPQRVQYMAPSACGKSTTYIVPTTYLLVEARNKVVSNNKNVSYKARVFVEGYTKSMLQALARQLQDDLIARMRAAGYTVLTYDDIKSDIAGAGRMAANPRYGMPTKGVRVMPDADFLVATPSDEQTLDYNLLSSPAAPYTAAIKRTQATLLVPEIYFTLPQIVPTTDATTYHVSAGVEVSPAMKLYAADMWGVPANLGWCNIIVAEHGMRLASPNTGEIAQLASDTADYGEWSRKSSDFAFRIDPQAFADGVARVGYAFNGLITDMVRKGHGGR